MYRHLPIEVKRKVDAGSDAVADADADDDPDADDDNDADNNADADADADVDADDTHSDADAGTDADIKSWRKRVNTSNKWKCRLAMAIHANRDHPLIFKVMIM